jgi:hypothetical protein
VCEWAEGGGGGGVVSGGTGVVCAGMDEQPPLLLLCYFGWPGSCCACLEVGWGWPANPAGPMLKQKG